MDKIARIRQEIERLKVDYLNRSYTFVPTAMNQLLEFLDTLSLSEEPDKSLEEAANKFAVFYDQGTCDGIAQDCFIAGAKWQKEQMLKDAVECELYWDGDFLAIDLDMAALGYSETDKVLVILKKEE